MQDFSGQVAVITGAGSGIGRALALELARQGCSLALADVDEAGLEQTRAGLAGSGVPVTLHRTDVSRRDQVQSLAEAVIASHGRVSLLFNNAGVACACAAERMSEEDFQWLMGVNFWGVVHGCQVFLPLLRAQPGAHIVNVSSVFGLIAMPSQSAYNASKFAVRGFSEALQQELAGGSVGLSVVCPGGVRTAIAANARVEASSARALGGAEAFVRRFDKLARTSADTAARQILQGVRRGRRRILVGPDARVLHWVLRLFPLNYDRVLRRLMPIPGVNRPSARGRRFGGE